jgi:ABC-type lipoprotein release transport system permease subunit
VFDVSTLAATAGLLALVVLLATFWPARRAASVDPMRAMRAD